MDQETVESVSEFEGKFVTLPGVTASSMEYVLREVSKASGVRKKQNMLCATVGALKSSARPEDKEFLSVLERSLYLAYDEFVRFGVSLEGHSIPAWVFDSISDPFDVNRAPYSLWDFVRPEGLLEKLQHESLSGDSKRTALFDLLKWAESESCARIVFDIVAKDLRCGIAAKTITKAFPGLLTEFEVMLASPAKPDKMAIPSLVEVKYDGMRVIAQVTGSSSIDDLEVSFYTRSGRPVPAMRELFTNQVYERAAYLMKAYPDLYGSGLCFDGEIIAGMDFNDLISDARNKSVQMKEGTYWVFDVIPIDVMSGLEESLTLTERRKHLTELFVAAGLHTPEVRLTNQLVVNSFAEAELIYRNVRQMPVAPGSTKNHEGIIIKNPNGRWQRKRSTDWMKLKACESADLTVVGYFLGTGKYEQMLGGLVVDFNGVEVSVGSGFSDDQRREFLAWIRDDLSSSRSKKLHGRLIEVEYQEVTNDGSLRHPVFVRLRGDKDCAEF